MVEGENQDNSGKDAAGGKEKTIVEEAREEREKLEKAREEMKKENDRAEQIEAQRALAGKSKGTAIVEKTEQEKYEEKAAERYKGTGLNPARGYKRQWD